MSKFNGLGKYQKTVRDAENEETSRYATEDSLKIMRKSLHLSQRTYIVACLTLIISALSLLISIMK